MRVLFETMDGDGNMRSLEPVVDEWEGQLPRIDESVKVYRQGLNPVSGTVANVQHIVAYSRKNTAVVITIDLARY